MNKAKSRTKLQMCSFPIDGFKDKNYESIISARDELAKLLKDNFDCEVDVGFVDAENPQYVL